MEIVSINLNKRLGCEATRKRFLTWLAVKRPDMILTQEPFRPQIQVWPSLDGYRMIHKTPHMACWFTESGAEPQVDPGSDRWQKILLPGFVLHHLYLSPNSAKERRELLAAVTGSASQGSHFFLGDFNLAPRPQDGLFDDRPSRFNSAAERRALQDLLHIAGLVDATCPERDEDIEFTFERTQKGKPLRFRCDLALVPKECLHLCEIRYDHTVRVGPEAFTDHSAIILSIDVAILAQQTTDPTPNEFRESGEEQPRRTQPARDPASAAHKTAIKRGSPSQIARKLYEQRVLKQLKVKCILDFGCGYGQDVRFYRDLGYDADGFDIEPRFGWTEVRDRKYDLVTAVFVVNVLPSIEDRLNAIRVASRYVRPGGYMLIAARSEKAVASEARKGHWERLGDGWISSPQKGTFQRGIRSEEIAWLLDAVGFQIAECRLRLSSDVSWLMGQRPVE